MKKIIYILFTLFVSINFSYAQNLSRIWVKSLNEITGNWGEQNFLKIDSDGNIIVGAYASIPSYIDTVSVNGGFIAKFTPDGQLIWCTKSDSTLNLDPKFLEIDINNNVYVFSRIDYNLDFITTALIKLNSNGEKQWVKTFKYKNSGFFYESEMVSLEIRGLEKIYLAWYLDIAYLVLPSGDTLHASNKYHILEFDTNGALTGNFTPIEQSVLKDYQIDENSNNYFLTSKPNGGSRLIKYNYNYNLMLNVKDFQYYYENFSLDNENNVYASKIGSDTSFGFSFNDTITHNNLFIVKYNNVFEQEWVKKFKGYRECPLPQLPSILRCLTDFGKVKIISNYNDIYVYGVFKYKFSIEGSSFYTPDSSKISFFISKFDNQGNYFWTEIFESYEDVDILNYSSFDLKISDDGSLICFLVFKSEVQICDSLYMCNGTVRSLLMRLQETGVGLKPTQENKTFYFEVYPNPAHNSVLININLENNKEFTIQIFDITGRCVLKENYKNSNQTIILDISKLNTGLYFVKVQANNQSNIKKLIVY